MRERTGVELRTPHSVLRLVVLALTLAGFVAMHGLASGGGDGSHCAAPVSLMSSVDPAPHGPTTPHGPAPHGPAPHGMADSAAMAVGVPADPTVPPAAGSPTVAALVAAVAPVDGGHGNGDGFMAGCVLALFGGLVALVLRLLRTSGADTGSSPVAAVPLVAWVARGPPQPLFLSLCVFRL